MQRLAVKSNNPLHVSQKILPGPCNCSSLSQNPPAIQNPYKSSLSGNPHRKLSLHCLKKQKAVTVHNSHRNLASVKEILVISSCLLKFGEGICNLTYPLVRPNLIAAVWTGVFNIHIAVNERTLDNS